MRLSARPLLLGLSCFALLGSAAALASPPPPSAPSAAQIEADKKVVETVTPAAQPAAADPTQAAAVTATPRLKLTYSGGEVPPMCLMRMVLGETVLPQLDIPSCERYRDTTIVKTYEKDGWYGSDYRYTSAPADEPVTTIMYRVVGDIAEGTVLELTSSSGGGSGRFSSAEVVKVQGDTLLMVNHIGGGDRCNHGLAKATVEDGVLTYGFYVTPADFVPLAFGNNRDLVKPEQLENSAASCFGIAYYQNSALDSVELLPAAFAQNRKGWTENFYRQSCMNDLLREAVKKRTEYLPAQFKILMQHFLRLCSEDNIKTQKALAKGEKLKSEGGK